MAVYEQSALLRCKDENGNEYLLYPITRLDCVDGAEDLVHYDKDQELTAVQKAQFLKNIGGLCAPVSAQANQFLKVSAVDANGNVTAVETYDIPTGSGSDDLTMIIEEADYENIMPDGTYILSSPVGLNVGETYYVSWDGVEYEVEAQDLGELEGASEGAVGIGNLQIIEMSGNDEPFAIISDPHGVIVFSLLVTEPTTHRIAVYQKGDPLATETYVKDYVKQSISGKITILEEKTYSNFITPEGIEGLVTYDTCKPFDFNIGETYYVNWDGTEYEVIAQDVYSETSTYVAMGNLTVLGLNGNDEPFAIVFDEDIITILSLLDTEPTEHTVSVYQKTGSGVVSSWNDLMDKPFGEEKSSVILFDGSYEAKYYASDSFWQGGYIPSISDVHLTNGETYIVTFDGIEYVCECTILNGFPFVGNPAVMGDTDNGIPFAIVEDVTGQTFGEPAFSWVPTPSSNPTADLTVSYNIKLVSECVSITKIDSKYLPMDVIDARINELITAALVSLPKAEEASF